MNQAEKPNADEFPVPRSFKILALVVALAGVHIVIWWGLVFSEYYERLVSPDQLLRIKSYLAGDAVLGVLAVLTIHGVRRAKRWVFFAGGGCFGAMSYVAAQAAVESLLGLTPRDVWTLSAVWPYLVLGLAGLVVFWRNRALMAPSRS
ncbi:MAG: hypothetical protein HYY13_07080 [Nitrospirae bacterium]|nr:hypothetical protein [Nitrospirota bacterium]